VKQQQLNVAKLPTWKFAHIGSETTAVERGKAAHLEIYANLQ